MVLHWLLTVTLGFGVETSCPTQALEAGRQRYSRGDYAGAAAALTDVEVCTDGSDVELADALRIRAQALAISGAAEASVDTWALLWTVLPSYVLDPLESPKFHQLYAEGRARAAQQQRVFARLVRLMVGYVVVQVFDPHRRVKRVNVVFDSMQMAATRRDDGNWHALAPEGALSASAMLESADAILFRTLKVTLHELPSPLEERVAARPQPSDHKKWVLLGGAALAVVAAGAIATAVALSTRRVDGSLGRLELP